MSSCGMLTGLSDDGSVVVMSSLFHDDGKGFCFFVLVLDPFVGLLSLCGVLVEG